MCDPGYRATRSTRATNSPGLRILFNDSASRCLGLAALDLAVDAPALRALRRSRGLSRARNGGRRVHQLLQPRQRILAVPLLTVIPLRLDDDHAIGGDALILARAKAQLDRFRQRRCADVEAQADRGRDLVDVLAAGALRADGGPYDLRRVDRGHGLCIGLRQR